MSITDSVNSEVNDVSKYVELDTIAQTLLVSIYNMKIGLRNMEINIRNYQKETKKVLNSYKNNKSKKNSTNGINIEKKEREPTGFAKKTKIRKELIDFFNNPEVSGIIAIISSEESLNENSKFKEMDSDLMISRPSTTKIINRYIKEKNLQNPSSLQHIIPDDKLKKILTPLEACDKKTGGYRFFNLQKYIKHLFYTTPK